MIDSVSPQHEPGVEPYLRLVAAICVNAVETLCRVEVGLVEWLEAGAWLATDEARLFFEIVAGGVDPLDDAESLDDLRRRYRRAAQGRRRE